MKVYLFDRTNRLIGYVEDRKLYDIKGRLKKENIPETTTLKTLVEILLKEILSKRTNVV